MAVLLAPGWADEPRELASGFDTLVLSLRGVASRKFLVSLAAAKEAARLVSDLVPFQFGGEEFLVAPGALARHTFRLQHAWGALGISDGDRLPVVRFQPRAEILHSRGPLGVRDWLVHLVSGQIEVISDVVSRVDLHADFQDLNFVADDVENFVARATMNSVHHSHDVFTGVSFGTRSSRSISARIYDKTEEIASKGGTYMFEVWGETFQPDEIVWRVECEMHRGFLHKFNVTTLDQLLEHVGALWQYFTQEWLSLRCPTDDSTRSRWPFDPRWHRVQQASFANHIVQLERVAASQVRETAEKEVPFPLGEIMRWAAILNTDSIEETLRTIPSYLTERLAAKGWDFAEQQRQKRILMGLIS